MTGAGPTGPLPYAYAGPVCTGRLRLEPEDFFVEELPLQAPDGGGDHIHLWVEKRALTTHEVAQAIAAHAGVGMSAVGYAGLKDKWAVTRQALTVQKSGDIDWAALGAAGVRILAVDRTRHKLRPGDLRGNRFVIRLRDAGPAVAEVAERLASIAAGGMPNYFGAQRFGRDGGNLPRARALLAGELRVGQHERGLLLSAARAHLFNLVLTLRVSEGNWNRVLPGDLLQLDDDPRWFGPVLAPDEQLVARVAALDSHPTGPLCGRPDPGAAPAADVAGIEARALAPEAGLCAALAGGGAGTDRRALRVRVGAPHCEQDGADLVIAFELPAGSYATVLLRELAETTSAHSA